MSDWKPLYFTLAIILIIGGLLPFIVGQFIDIGDIEVTGVIATMVDFVNHGLSLEIFDITFFGFSAGLPDFDLFFFIGETARAYVVNSLTVFSIIPQYIQIPLFILMVVGLVYTVIKLMPTT